MFITIVVVWLSASPSLLSELAVSDLLAVTSYLSLFLKSLHWEKGRSAIVTVIIEPQSKGK